MNIRDDVIPKVLSNEATCRVWLKELQRKGIKLDPDPDNLSHEDCIEVGIRIYTELLRKEIQERS